MPVDSQRLLLMKLQNLLGLLVKSRKVLDIIFICFSTFFLGGTFEFTVSCNVTFLLVLLALSKLLFFRLVICFTVRLIRGWLNLDDDILDGTDACSIFRMFDLKRSHISLIALSRLNFSLNCLTISDAWSSNLSLFAFFQIWVIFKKMKTLCDIEGEISNWTNWHNFGRKIMSIWYIFRIQLLSAIYDNKKKNSTFISNKVLKW